MSDKENPPSMEELLRAAAGKQPPVKPKKVDMTRLMRILAGKPEPEEKG